LSLRVKIADCPGEFDQIARLNYRIFVEEIPQHPENSSGERTDPFHHENLYFICLDGDRVVGMVALRDRRPFSLDAKLDALDTLLPPHSKPCEVRLLAIPPDRRRGRILFHLLQAVLGHWRESDYDIGLISGRVESLSLYERLGFRAFGPTVGKPGARYQPMYITWVTANVGLSVFPADPSDANDNTLNLLPGPVRPSAKVREALVRKEISHRSPGYVDLLGRVKSRLRMLTDAECVQILLGSGTLANDVVAGQLALLPGEGLILSNGEFGERLTRHARGFGLRFREHRQEWGERFDIPSVERLLDENPGIRWIWAVHCETSTGQINPVSELRRVCAARDLLLNLDCISSLGVVPVDLNGVHMASGVSGKGLGAPTGLALVFHRDGVAEAPHRLPRYLDLGHYARCGGIPFSGSSQMLSALLAALKERGSPAFRARMEDLSRWFSGRLIQEGIPLLLALSECSPSIFSIPLPPSLPSGEVGARLEAGGFLVYYNGDYLLRRNWIQVSLLSGHSSQDLERFIEVLVRLMTPRYASA
jgi:aspartate aminotransferase-like enzyme